MSSGKVGDPVIHAETGAAAGATYILHPRRSFGARLGRFFSRLFVLSFVAVAGFGGGYAFNEREGLLARQDLLATISTIEKQVLQAETIREARDAHSMTIEVDMAPVMAELRLELAKGASSARQAGRVRSFTMASRRGRKAWIPGCVRTRSRWRVGRGRKAWIPGCVRTRSRWRVGRGRKAWIPGCVRTRSRWRVGRGRKAWIPGCVRTRSRWRVGRGRKAWIPGKAAGVRPPGVANHPRVHSAGARVAAVGARVAAVGAPRNRKSSGASGRRGQHRSGSDRSADGGGRCDDSSTGRKLSTNPLVASLGSSCGRGCRPRLDLSVAPTGHQRRTRQPDDDSREEIQRVVHSQIDPREGDERRKHPAPLVSPAASDGIKRRPRLRRRVRTEMSRIRGAEAGLARAAR